MTTMPYWMNKTPEMVAMDKWFSADLENRYTRAIASINTSQAHNGLPTASEALASMGAAGAAKAFQHFGADWLNPTNPSSGGNFWPHVPTLMIIPWLRQGLLNAAHKGLGSAALSTTLRLSDAAITNLFKSEKEDSKLTDDELREPKPLVTTWVCTSPPGMGSIQVDAVRGPTVVELIIATPQPQTVQSRLWSSVSGLIDEQWVILHGGNGGGGGGGTVDLSEQLETA